MSGNAVVQYYLRHSVVISLTSLYTLFLIITLVNTNLIAFRLGFTSYILRYKRGNGYHLRRLFAIMLNDERWVCAIKIL